MATRRCPPPVAAGPSLPNHRVAPRAPRLRGPETPDIMSYCPGPQWISPYNYLRAMDGPVLSGHHLQPAVASAPDPQAVRAEGQKLLLAFRLHRDERIEFRWALHLPGEPAPQSAKGVSDLVLELYDAEGSLLASASCHRPADRPTTAPHEDFQEVLPWFKDVAICAGRPRPGRARAVADRGCRQRTENQRPDRDGDTPRQRRVHSPRHVGRARGSGGASLHAAVHA